MCSDSIPCTSCLGFSLRLEVCLWHGSCAPLIHSVPRLCASSGGITTAGFSSSSWSQPTRCCLPPPTRAHPGMSVPQTPGAPCPFPYRPPGSWSHVLTEVLVYALMLVAWESLAWVKTVLLCLHSRWSDSLLGCGIQGCESFSGRIVKALSSTSQSCHWGSWAFSDFSLVWELIPPSLFWKPFWSLYFWCF